MTDIIVSEKVINKAMEPGTIVAFDNQYITVDFQSRVAMFQCDAFERGFLRYENEALQNKVNEAIAQLKIEGEQKEEERHLVTQKLEADRMRVQSAMAESSSSVTILSASIRLDPAPIQLRALKKREREWIQPIFAECDRDTETVFSSFNPKMEYPRYTSQSRSKYCVGFLSKHLDTYVFRVFSRNDVYKKTKTQGVTVMQSDTTEVFRILFGNGRMYYFAKNICIGMGYFNNTQLCGQWRISDLTRGVMLNEVIRNCDCGYLNDHIVQKEINCSEYVKLLFPALHNNKAEIVFKNNLFSSAYRIENIVAYLEQFSSKQIDFASKNNVLNTLPIIKRYGTYELDILRNMEALMRNRRSGVSICGMLNWYLSRLGFDCSDLGRKLIGFLRKVDHFDPAVYYDYICELAEHPGVTVKDFFDKNYIERHNIMLREKLVDCDDRDYDQYLEAAKKLSWIDRVDNGYFITVPKNVSEIKYEGDIQHNCVYTCRYHRLVINGESIVVFLRKDADVPFVTIEFDYETFEVLQAYGKFNQKISSSLYEYIVSLGKRLKYEMLSQQ